MGTRHPVTFTVPVIPVISTSFPVTTCVLFLRYSRVNNYFCSNHWADKRFVKGLMVIEKVDKMSLVGTTTQTKTNFIIQVFEVITTSRLEFII